MRKKVEVEIRAIGLYKMLIRVGPLPKTFKVEEITAGHDMVTGKRRERKTASRHALVSVRLDKRSVTVDYNKLKDVAKKLGKETIRIRVLDSLIIDHGGGSFTLYDTRATPAATFNFDTGEIKRNPEVQNALNH